GGENESDRDGLQKAGQLRVGGQRGDIAPDKVADVGGQPGDSGLEASRDRGYPLPDARIGDHHRLMIGGAAAGANGYTRLEARAGGRRAGGRIAPTNLLCCGHDGHGRFGGDDTMLLRVSTFSVVWGLLREFWKRHAGGAAMEGEGACPTLGGNAEFESKAGCCDAALRTVPPLSSRGPAMSGPG